MTGKRRPDDIVVASVVEDLYLAFRGLPGFQGADLTLRSRAGGRQDVPVLRLHVAPARAEDIADLVPKMFGDLALEVTRVAYGFSPMGEPPLRPAQHVTGGSACSADPLGRGVRGQVTLMACDRDWDRVGLLTGLAAVGGGAGPEGSAVFGTGAGRATAPTAHVAATCFNRSGAAAFAVLDPAHPWLPIERPENLSVTSLRRPVLGEVLRAASGPVRVDGIGIYRVRGGRGRIADVEGFRTRSDVPPPSGALVYDDQSCSGVGLATACARSAGAGWLTVTSELARVMAALDLRLASYDDLFRADPFPHADAHVATERRRVAQAASNLDAMLGDPRDAVLAEVEDPPAAGDLAPNRRPDIATMIWPPLSAALRRTRAHPVRGITDRIERLDPTGRARAALAAAINASTELSSMGLRRVEAADFRCCVAYDQVCERLCDILTELVE